MDVAEEIAAGRMRQLEGGSYVVVNSDGTDAEMGDAEDLNGAFDKAGEGTRGLRGGAGKTTQRRPAFSIK